MHRWASALFGVFVLAAVAIVVLNTRRPDRNAPIVDAAVSASAEMPVASATPPPQSSSEPDSGPDEPGVDGSPPPLPEGAPRSVQIGVIQFTYRGAERAPQDAPTRQAALERANATLPAAQADFDSAVSRGDAGSSPDLGRVPRGVLEPGVEFAVFTLEPGEVSKEPLDTPRGYWIVRRNH